MENDLKIIYRSTAYFSLVLLLFVLVGFYKTYFGLIPHFEKTTALIHWHFTFLMSWVILLIVQPILARYGKIRIHRILGKITYVLAPLIITTLILLLIRYWKKYHLETYPLKDILIACHSQAVHALQFAAFYILALVYKKNVVLHGSYMLATGLIFINPSLIRALGIFNLTYDVAETIVIIITALATFTLLLYARKKGVNYRPYIFIFLIFLLHDIPMLLKIWVWWR